MKISHVTHQGEDSHQHSSMLDIKVFVVSDDGSLVPRNLDRLHGSGPSRLHIRGPAGESGVRRHSLGNITIPVIRTYLPVT